MHRPVVVFPVITSAKIVLRDEFVRRRRRRQRNKFSFSKDFSRDYPLKWHDKLRWQIHWITKVTLSQIFVEQQSTLIRPSNARTSGIGTKITMVVLLYLFGLFPTYGSSPLSDNPCSHKRPLLKEKTRFNETIFY